MRQRVGVPESLNKRVDRKALNWFGHVERMGGQSLTKTVYMSEVRGERWMDGLRKTCAERGVGLEEAKGLCRDRNEWGKVTDKNYD